MEADSFWCLSRLLDGIQDNYISAQPGIQRSVKRMAELVSRIDCTYLMMSNVKWHLRSSSYSAINRPSTIWECGVHAVCFPVDELSSDAGIECQKHDSNVGCVPCEWKNVSVMSRIWLWRYMLVRGFGSFFAIPPLCLFRFPHEMEQELEGNGFPGTFTVPEFAFVLIDLAIFRELSCSSNPCQHRNGQKNRSKSF